MNQVPGVHRLAAAAAFALMVALAAGAEGKRVALVVGVDRYERFSSLRAASRDAAVTADRLRVSGYDSVELLAGGRPGGRTARAELVAAMARVESDFGKETIDELTFFFAGHGTRAAGKNRLRLSDAAADGTGTVSMEDDVLPWIRRLGARLSVVLIDACRDEAEGPWGMDIGTTSAASSDARRSVLLLYAASPGSSSYEAKDGSGGYFTRVLLDALDNGCSTLAELVEYVTRVLPALTLAEYGAEQRPGAGGDFDAGLSYSPFRAGNGPREKAEIIVRTDPPGAVVRIGDREIGKSPLVYSAALSGTLRVSARSGTLAAEKEVRLERGRTATIDLKLSEPAGRVFFAADERIKSYSVDGGPFLPLSNMAFINLPTGRRNLRVIVEGDLFWEGSVEIAAEKTLQVFPQFIPRGELDVTLPEGALLFVRAMDGGREYLFSLSESEQAFPSGDYEAQTSGERYLPWRTHFTVGRGSRFSLAPALEPTELGKCLTDIEQLGARLAKEKNVRGSMDAGGWAALGIGFVTAILGAKFYADYLQAGRAYGDAGLGADFVSLRDSVTGNRNAAVGCFAASCGFFLSAGTLFLAGPRPLRTTESLDAAELKLKSLRKEN